MNNIWLIVKVFFICSLIVTGFELADIKLLEAVGTDISPILPFMMAGITFLYCDFSTDETEDKPVPKSDWEDSSADSFSGIQLAETLPKKEKEYQRSNEEKAAPDNIPPAEPIEPPTDTPVGLPVEPPTETPVEFPTVPSDSGSPVEPPTDTPASPISQHAEEKSSPVQHPAPTPPPDAPVQGEDPMDEPEPLEPMVHPSDEDVAPVPPDDIPTDVMPV